MNTTRRKLIAGAAALPLLPATAIAAPVTLPLLPVSAFAAPADDPVLAAFAEWQAADREHDRAVGVYCGLETRHGNKSKEIDAYDATVLQPASDRKSETEALISHMVPTTFAGLVAQLRVAVAMHDAYFGANGLYGDDQDRLLVSMLAGAERMAGVAS